MADEGTMAFGEFRGLDLQRVVIAPKQPGQDLQVLAIELYEDGVIVRWVRPGGFTQPQSDEEVLLDPSMGGSMMLSDDAGTAYKFAGMHAGGGSIARGEIHFVPAAPAEAWRISVITQAGTVDIPLGD